MHSDYYLLMDPFPVYGKKLVTSGCSSDIKNATQVATGMIRVSGPNSLSGEWLLTSRPAQYYGYSEELGPVHFGDDTSPAKRGEIDAEIKRSVSELFHRTTRLLTPASTGCWWTDLPEQKPF